MIPLKTPSDPITLFILKKNSFHWNIIFEKNCILTESKIYMNQLLFKYNSTFGQK